jgi:hypothetical protein
MRARFDSQTFRFRAAEPADGMKTMKWRLANFVEAGNAESCLKALQPGHSPISSRFPPAHVTISMAAASRNDFRLDRRDLFVGALAAWAQFLLPARRMRI